jgi:hypothetical protein
MRGSGSNAGVDDHCLRDCARWNWCVVAEAVDRRLRRDQRLIKFATSVRAGELRAMLGARGVDDLTHNGVPIFA